MKARAGTSRARVAGAASAGRSSRPVPRVRAPPQAILTSRQDIVNWNRTLTTNGYSVLGTATPRPRSSPAERRWSRVRTDPRVVARARPAALRGDQRVDSLGAVGARGRAGAVTPIGESPVPARGLLVTRVGERLWNQAVSSPHEHRLARGHRSRPSEGRRQRPLARPLPRHSRLRRHAAIDRKSVVEG